MDINFISTILQIIYQQSNSMNINPIKCFFSIKYFEISIPSHRTIPPRFTINPRFLKNRQTPLIYFIFKHIADTFGYRYRHPENFIKIATLINYLLVNSKTLHSGSTVTGDRSVGNIYRKWCIDHSH